MPLRRALHAPRDIIVSVLVELLVLLRANRADLGVGAAELALGVEDGVNVQAGCRGLAGELAEALDQGFLEVVG